MSWKRLQDMSWKLLQHVFNVTIFRLPRLLEGISQDILKTSWKTNIVTLRESSRHLQDMSWGRPEEMSWRRLQDMSWKRLEYMSWRHIQTCWKNQNVYWGYLYLKNLNLCLTYLYLTNLYLTNLWRIQNTLIRTQQIQSSSILKVKQQFYFKN